MIDDPGPKFTPAGAGVPTYVNETPLLSPLGVVTMMCTAPLAAGETAVIRVADSIVNEVAGMVPNSTAVAPLRFVPVRMTSVPPMIGPERGLAEIRVGAVEREGVVDIVRPPRTRREWFRGARIANSRGPDSLQ
jgi:hypothetical protein